MQEERSYSRLEWISYIVVLPLIFTAVLSGLVLQFLGYNVSGRLLDLARNTPVINAVVPADAKTLQQQSKVTQLESQIQAQKQQIDSIQKERDASTQQSTAKDVQIAKLQSQIADLKKQLADQKTSDEYWADEARVFAIMSPSKAADIISQKPLDQARAILSHMKIDQKAAVLEKMDPTLAAKMQ